MERFIVFTDTQFDILSCRYPVYGLKVVLVFVVWLFG